MFRKDFVWGAAASSYQIEGAAFEDGKGKSIWDVFTAQKGKIWGNHTGETACDHYHRFKEDVALMKKLGLTAYRFSLSWTRILPEGTDAVNQQGVDFYNAGSAGINHRRTGIQIKPPGLEGGAVS